MNPCAPFVETPLKRTLDCLRKAMDDDQNDCCCCLICSCFGLQYLAVIASLVLQWILFANLHLSGLEYLSDLSLAAAILSSLGVALNVLCFMCERSDNKSVKWCCTLLVKLPKVVAEVLNIVIALEHIPSSCLEIDDCPSISPGEMIYLNQLRISVASVAGASLLFGMIAVIITVCTGRPLPCTNCSRYESLA